VDATMPALRKNALQVSPERNPALRVRVGMGEMMDKYLAWFKAHERIIVIFAVLTFGYFGLNKWLDKSAIDAQMKAAVATQVAQVQHDADQKIAAAVAQQTALFNQTQALHEQEIASLVAAVASRDAASNQKINQITQPKTTQEAVTDLNSVYQFPTPLTLEQAGSVPVSDLQAFTVAKVEAQTAQADLTDTRKELDSTGQALSQATGLVGALQNQVTGLQTELKDQAVADKKELDAAKAIARQGKMKWFKIGYVAGLVTGWFGHR
jgi:hypothetical protein